MRDSIKRRIKNVLVGIYHGMTRVLPVNHKKIIFMSNMGRNYSDNPKAMYEAMRKDGRFSCLKPIWVFNGDYLKKIKDLEGRSEEDTQRKFLPRGCRMVRYGGLRYYFHMATAGIWVFNTRQEPYLIKRKGTLYFMTWHGTPLKKLGLDLDRLNMTGEDRDLDSYKESFIKEAAKWDFLIVQNDFSEKVLPRSLGYKGDILKIGYPRNDRLVKARKAARVRDVLEAVGKRISNSDGKKQLLYAPTWRDDEYLRGGFYKGPSGIDFTKLEKALGNKYRIALKLHYLTDGKAAVPESCRKSGFVKVYGNETDITDLYIASDGLITDYSSVFFDYSVLERPIFFFCYDLEKYRDELRGFYLNLEEFAPGPISTDENGLIRDLKDCFEKDDFKYVERVRAFKKTYNEYDDGHSSEKALDAIAGKRGIARAGQ